MELYDLFKRCNEIGYNHVQNAGDFAVERIEKTLYIYLECSNGREDWKNNLDFPAKAYKRMDKTVWYAHRGFLKVWKSMELHLRPHILDKTVESIITVGYSHGAALAILCHEYVWFNRPELRKSTYGYGFGAPRVLWGPRNDNIKTRWKQFTVIRNIDDIVTHVPPSFLGYYHVGTMLEIGKKGKYSKIDAHRPESYLNELKK